MFYIPFTGPVFSDSCRWPSSLQTTPLSVLGAGAEGSSISEGTVQGDFRIPSLHPLSAEDGVLITVQLRLGHHQAGVVLCASVFNAYGEAHRGILGEMAFSLSVVVLVVGPMHPVVFSAPAKPHSQHSRGWGPGEQHQGLWSHHGA